MHKNLCVDLTEDCNMRCPWCIATNSTQKVNKTSGPLLQQNKEVLFNHIKDTKYSMISFHGGECTLYPELLFETMDFARKTQSDIKLKLFTNGSLLTKDMIQQLNIRDVIVCVSCAARGYKDLLNMYKSSDNPCNLINNIKSLNKLCIRIVCLRGKEFAHEALLLHDIFGCHVEIDPDYTQLENWTDEDFILFEREMNMLRTFDTENWSSILGDMCEACDCPHMNLHFYTSGRFGRSAKYHAEYKTKGCAMIHKLMGDERYERYYKIVRGANYDKRPSI